MTLEKIENHVVSEATARAAELTRQTREEAGKITADVREEADADHASGIERLKADLKNAFDRSIGKLRADQRLEMLKIKTGILDAAFTKAGEKLLTAEGYRAVLRRQLGELAGQEGAILCRARDRKIVGKMIGELNSKLDGKVPPLSEENADILGGFILRGKRMDIDFSLDLQLETFRERVLPELIREAFPEE